MAYSNFNLSEVLERFELSLIDSSNLFGAVVPRAPSELLSAWLAESVPLALDLSTEKARSEGIIAPILLEVRRLLGKQVSLFSGIDFTVDTEKGLNGECDFLFSRSPEQLLLRAPVVTVVEAKNENFKNGIAQACAEMLAARIFNERKKQPIERIYGAVTTGDVWRFLMLENQTLYADAVRYDLDDLNKIIGILCTMLEA
jgi:hypothetical protein